MRVRVQPLINPSEPLLSLFGKQPARIVSPSNRYFANLQPLLHPPAPIHPHLMFYPESASVFSH